MPHEIVFVVEEDTADGGLVATALGHGIATQADSEADLRAMILDAVHCHFDSDEERPKVVRLHFVREELLSVAR